MIGLLLRAQSVNEYLIKKNILGLVWIYAIRHFLSPLPVLRLLLQSRIYVLLEKIAVFILLKNIFETSCDALGYKVKWTTDDRLFTSICRLPQTIRDYTRQCVSNVKSATKPSQPQQTTSQAPKPQQTSFFGDSSRATLGDSEWRNLLNQKIVNIGRDATATSAQQQASSSTTATNSNVQEIDDWLLRYREKQLRRKEAERSPWVEQVLRSMRLEEERPAMQQQPEVQTHMNVFASTIERTDENRETKHTTYRPAYFRHPEIITKTDRRLWQALNHNHDQMPYLVDRFRLEQWDDFQRTWHKFDSKDADIYVTRLKKWFYERILAPLVRTLRKVNMELGSVGANSTLADCYPFMAQLLAQAFEADHHEINLAQLQDYLEVPGYESSRCKRYIIERITDIANNPELWHFRYIPPEEHLPSDPTIFMHLFKQYLIKEMPSVIPPLIPVEGGFFRFLVRYFYITPELYDEIFSA